MPDTISGYLEQVRAQIRWKRAQPALLQELETHLLDQRDACMAADMTAEEAEREALRQMGDPVETGAALDRVHRPRPQWGLLALIVVLAVVCCVLRVWLTEDFLTGGMLTDRALLLRNFIIRNALGLAAGLAVLTGCYLADVSVFTAHGKAVFAAAMLCVVELTVHPPMRVSGVSLFARYIAIMLPTAYACWLCAFRSRGWRGICMAAAGGLLALGVTAAIPYILGFVVFAVTADVLLLAAAWEDWFGIGRKRTLALLGLGNLAVLGLAWFLIRVRGLGAYRLTMAFHPEMEPYAGGYQALSVRGILQGVQLWGQGTLPSTVRDGSLLYAAPALDSDFLLTNLLYRLGWIPFFLFMAGFVLLLIWVAVRCLRQRGCMGRLVALSVAVVLGLQALLSVAANLGFVLLPAHFPLLMGCWNTNIDLALLGLALSVFRGAELPQRTAAAVQPKRWMASRVRFQNGELTIRLSRCSPSEK